MPALTPLRKTGIEQVGDLAWGSHFRLSFESGKDLLGSLIPYIQAGLAARELCIWLVPAPFTVAEGRNALREAIPEFERYLDDGNIEIEMAGEWCLKQGAADLEGLTRTWDKAIERAARGGLEGVRFCGWPSWFSRKDWSDLRLRLDESVAGKRIIVLCPSPPEATELRQSKDRIRRLNDEVRRRIVHTRNADDVAFLQSVSNVLELAAERDDLELAQRREKELLQTIFDNIPVMISVFDASGRLVRANREWEEVLGWTLAEAQQTDILAEAYPGPEERRAVVEFIRKAERRWADFKPRTRRGSVIDVSWARFRLSDGSAIGFGLDVSERKRALEALAESEARFAKMFHVSPVALGMSMIDELIVDVNQSWLDLMGYHRQEVVGRPMSDLNIWVDPAVRQAITSRLDAEGSVRDIECPVRAKSGEVLDLLVSAVRVDVFAEPCVIFAVIDITARKRAEAERAQLLASERRARGEAEAALERLRAVESITDTALAHLDLDDLLRELLARVRRVLGADSAAVLLLEDGGGVLYPRAVDGYAHESGDSIRVRIGSGVSGKIAAEGRPLIVDDYSTVDMSGIEGVPPSDIRSMVRSVMGAPLRIGTKVVGVVAVNSSTPRHFTEEELTLLLLVADRVAPSIERARLVETVRAGRARLKALSTRLLTAHEEERRRLSVELHDELGQVLTAVKLNLESLERMPEAAPLSAQLTEAIGSVVRAMETVRDLALNLRPAVLDDLGLPAALRWYAERFARDTGIDVHLSVEAALRVEPALETVCFRVAQEALTNIARHAQAKNVWLDLHLPAEQLELYIHDDGIGFDPAAAWQRAVGGGSLGLLGMEERVSLLGGELKVRSSPGGGTEVLARFPGNDEARDAR